MEWNSRINLISRKDTENFETRHLLHSLSILKFISFHSKQRVLDIGTGGGLPGIPLAICFPETEFVLCDSKVKKTDVVFDMADQLDLDNVTVVNGRVENLKNSFDFAVTRAVAPTAKLLEWTKGKLKRNSTSQIQNGLIALKGGDLSEELSGIKNKWDIKHLSDWFEEPFFETKQLLHVSL